ncbi:unnamed protein product [Rotaria sp. Silwood1]|nr:unnamed protein product [Rotaria sp. Silwood1]
MSDISTEPDEILQGDSFDDITWSSLLLSSKRNQILKTLRESSHYDQNTFNELLNNTLKFKEENPLDYRTLWITKNNTSQTAYEFPLAEVDGHDRLSLYWFHLCESDRGNVIRVRCLRNNVTGHILKSKDFNIDRTLSKMKCKTRKQYSYENDHYWILSSEAQFSRFSRLYPYIVQCIILKTESKNKHVRILVEKEDKVILSYEKCVFVPYDSTVGHHNLVYLYNKIHEEEESNLKYDNVIAEAILRNFNDEQLKYESYVSFEDTSIIVQPTIQSNRYRILPVKLPFNFNFIVFLINTFLKRTWKGTLETTRKFVQRPVPHDGHCLFSSLRNALSIADKITMKDLRKQAADYNRQSGKIDEQCLFYETKKNLEQYCDEIENTDVWGGEPEILAIAELYETSVRVIRIDPQQSCVSISEFPSNQTSFKKCCYIILNNNHYESLHLRIGNNSNDEHSIFDSNDEEIPKMLVFGQDPIDLHRVKVEICIVTRTINRCIYIHPYYKFYKPEKGREYSVSNPIFIHLGYDTDYEHLTNIKGNLTEINGILNMKYILKIF